MPDPLPVMCIGSVWPHAATGAARAAARGTDLAGAVARVCRRHGLRAGDPSPTAGPGWRGLAWWPSVAGAEPAARHEALARELRDAAAALGADLAVTSGALAAHGPALVVSDVDSTFVEGEVIDELAAHAGSERLVADVTARAMRGELDFRASLHQRVATLRGLDAAALAAVRGAVRLSPGAVELVAALRGFGIPLGLISGGFAEVVEPLADALGIDLVHANRLAQRDGRLTGEVTGEVVDDAAKVTTTRGWAADLGVGLDRVVALGDGANDLPLLRAAALGVAYCAKPLVVAQAPATLGFPRIDALLGLLGRSAPASTGR